MQTLFRGLGGKGVRYILCNFFVRFDAFYVKVPLPQPQYPNPRSRGDASIPLDIAPLQSPFPTESDSAIHRADTLL